MDTYTTPGPVARAARRAWRAARRLPWRSGGASALLIAVISGFDDSTSDSDGDMFGSSGESSAAGSSDDSSTSDGNGDGSGSRRRRNAMTVRADGSPDPSALTDQDYRDIPGAPQ